MCLMIHYKLQRDSIPSTQYIVHKLPVGPVWYLLSYLSKMRIPRFWKVMQLRSQRPLMATLGPKPGNQIAKPGPSPRAAALHSGTWLSPHSTNLAEPQLPLASLWALFSPARSQLQPLQSATHVFSKYLLRVHDVPRTVLGVRGTKINKTQS